MSSYEINNFFIDKLDWIKIQSLSLELDSTEWSTMRKIIKIGIEILERELEKESGMKNEQNRKS